MLVTDAVATTLTKLGAPRHAETPRSGDIPERWPRRGSRLIGLRPGGIPGRDAWLDALSEVRLDSIARI